MEKYYTPLFEEFHSGFECEYRDNPEKDAWERIITDVDFIGIVYHGFTNQYEPYIYDKRFRVKYLDEDDLGELNFKRIGDGQFESNSDNYLSLEYFVEDKGWYLTYSENESQFGFGGFIKNKSELKRLLVQLNAL